MTEVQYNGRLTTNLIPQLCISRLIKAHYIVDGKSNGGDFQADEDSPLLHLTSDCKDEDRVLNIKYETLNGSGVMDYNIKICTVPSNLGGGKKILYWICPVSGLRAKKLYYSIKDHIFTCRKAYPQPLYYECQTYRKAEKLYSYSSFNQDKILNSFLKMKKEIINGELTKINKTIGKLVDRKILLDRLINDWNAKYAS